MWTGLNLPIRSGNILYAIIVKKERKNDSRRMAGRGKSARH